MRQGIYTALLAQTEVLSALQRKVREGTLAAAEAQRLARRVQRHFARRYRLVAITPARVTQANTLVQAHPLRAYDALHLACALAVRETLQQYGLPAPLCVFHGFLPPNPWEGCHSIHVKAATQST